MSYVFNRYERRIADMHDLLATPRVMVKLKEEHAADLDQRLHYIGVTVKPGQDYADVAAGYGLRDLTSEERRAYVSEKHTSTDSNGSLPTEVRPVEGHFRIT